MGLNIRETILLVLCAALMIAAFTLEVLRARAVSRSHELELRLNSLEAEALSWQGKASAVQQLLEREEQRRKSLWNENDSLHAELERLLKRKPNAKRPVPVTVRDLRESIIRAIGER